MLVLQIVVDCPGCNAYLDLLDHRDTGGVDLDGEWELVEQVFPAEGSHEDFECEGVVCSRCKGVFDVRGLEW